MCILRCWKTHTMDTWDGNWTCNSQNYKLSCNTQQRIVVNHPLCPVMMNGVFAFLADIIGPKPWKVLKIPLGILLMSDWAEGVQIWRIMLFKKKRKWGWYACRMQGISWDQVQCRWCSPCVSLINVLSQRHEACQTTMKKIESLAEKVEKEEYLHRG